METKHFLKSLVFTILSILTISCEGDDYNVEKNVEFTDTYFVNKNSKVGETLTVGYEVSGDVTTENLEVILNWYRVYEDGTTKLICQYPTSSYTLTDRDVGSFIFATVAATNAINFNGFGETEPIGPIQTQ